MQLCDDRVHVLWCLRAAILVHLDVISRQDWDDHGHDELNEHLSSQQRLSAHQNKEQPTPIHATQVVT